MDIKTVLHGDETDAEAIKLIKNKRVANLSKSSIVSLFDITNKSYIKQMVNPSSKYIYSYILLDTNNAAPELSSDTTYGWRFENYSVLSPGTINSINNARNLVGMRIFPITMHVSISTINDATKDYYNPFISMINNVTLLIHEFQAQSYIGRDNRKYHFSLFPTVISPINTKLSYDEYNINLDNTNSYYEFSTSRNGNGWFWFKQPIIEFSTLTVSLASPFNLIRTSSDNRILIPIQLIYMADSE